MKHENGRSRGFGFITFTSKNAATIAIEMMNGHQLGKKRLRVSFKREQPPGMMGNGMGNGPNGGGSGGVGNNNNNNNFGGRGGHNHNNHHGFGSGRGNYHNNNYRGRGHGNPNHRNHHRTHHGPVGFNASRNIRRF